MSFTPGYHPVPETGASIFSFTSVGASTSQIMMDVITVLSRGSAGRKDEIEFDAKKKKFILISKKKKIY